MIVLTFFGRAAKASTTSTTCARVTSSLNLYITMWRRTLSAASTGMAMRAPKATKMKKANPRQCINEGSSKQCFRRIRDRRALDVRKRRDLMIVDPLGREKMADLPAAGDECI